MSQSYADFGAKLGLPQSLLSTIHDLGYETPTPIQEQAIPLILEGRDILATAQTGTGKTAAFALPLISRMLQGQSKPVLIVAPTRELAEQIGRVLIQLTGKARHLSTCVIIGGSSYSRQIHALRARPAFVVGTPGRLLDQVELKHLKIAEFGTLVMDEADRMLDMGFEPQMNALIARMSPERQSLLFSATLPDSILRLANSYMREPVRVTVGAVSKPVDKITQQVVNTTAADKENTLIREIDKVAGSLIVFTRTKYRAEKVAKVLTDAGHDVARIHGDRSQRQRSMAISEFRTGRARILVATDIAARGIDVPDIRYIVNFDLPDCAEDYIHRIGRTARAGADGHALAFVTPQDKQQWARIHKLIYGKYPETRNKGHANREERRASRFSSRGPQGGRGGQRGDRRRDDRSRGPRRDRDFDDTRSEFKREFKNDRHEEARGSRPVPRSQEQFVRVERSQEHSNEQRNTYGEVRRPWTKHKPKQRPQQARFDRPEREERRGDRRPQRDGDRPYARPHQGRGERPAKHAEHRRHEGESRPERNEHGSKPKRFGKPFSRPHRAGAGPGGQGGRKPFGPKTNRFGGSRPRA